MPKKVLHLISQAHLDPVWLWPLRDGISEALTTLQSAVDRAAENPDFQFTRSSSCTYQWAKEMDPTLYASIKKLVAAGRWEVVGGWIEQPDCNLPSAESFIRQALYGKAFFEREFGSQGRTHIGYNPDSFGHSGALPKVLQHTDFNSYAFMRPLVHDNPDIPMLFWWASDDGSRVLGCRIPTQYSQSYAANADDMEQTVRYASENHFVEGIDHGVMWFGVGNHGGGPTREHIARIKELQADDSLPEIRFSTAREFLASVLESGQAEALPVIRGELGYTLRGCYSATSEVKQKHRFCEKALYAAESLDVLAMAERASADVLKDAWHNHLFNEFHDILAGTCAPLCQGETNDRYGASLHAAREQRFKSTARMARAVDTSGETGSVLFAANPLPWARTAIVQFDTFAQPHGREEITHLETQDGKQIPIQWMTSDANFGPWGLKWGKLTAALELPAGGYEVFRVVTKTMENPVKAVLPFLEGESSQMSKDAEEASEVVQTTQEPALTSWQQDALGEILQEALGTVVIKDEENTWGFGVLSYDEALGQPEIFETETLEDGPLVRVIRQKSRWQSSEIWMDIIHCAHTPDIEVRFRINWQEKRQILKLNLSTRLEDTKVTAKMAGESVERPVDGREYACHDWLALSGQLDGQPAAIGLINDSSYSYDAKDARLRMILARGAAHAEHPPFEYKDERNIPFLDQGWQERRFLLVAGADRQSLNLERKAQEFQIAAEHLLDSAHPGTEPWKQSHFAVEPENVSTLALKPAESGCGTIVRLLETEGRDTEATLKYRGAEWQLGLKAHALASYELRKGEAPKQVNGLEQGD